MELLLLPGMGGITEEKSIIIDLIRNTENDKHVKGHEGNKRYSGGDGYITLTKHEDPIIGSHTLQGYKLYIHELPQNSPGITYKLSSVSYNTNEHSGFANLEIFRKASVLYFSHDKYNISPLLVEFSTDQDKLNEYFVDYYKYNGSKQWSYEHKVDASQIFLTISQVLESVGYPVVLNLNTQTQYCINGESTVKSIDHRISCIDVSLSQTIGSSYECYTHRVQSRSDMRILSTCQYGINTAFEKKHNYRKFYTHANVYYWTLDLHNALILQLGDGDEFFTLENGYWKKNPNINNESLPENLDKQNCLVNNAHIIDISNPNEYYFCSNCREKMISVIHEKKIHKYDRQIHTMNTAKFSISGFKESKIPQGGLPSAENVSKVCIYNYVGTPFLVQIKKEAGGNSWYKRGKNGKWVVSSEPSGKEDEIASKILAETLRDPELKTKFLTIAYNELQEHLSSKGSVTLSESSNSHTVFSERQKSINTVAVTAGGSVGGVTAIGLGTFELYNFFTHSTRSVIRIILATFSKPM